MSAEVKMQLDPPQGPTSRLLQRAWSYDLLAEYVSQLGRDNHEEEIFRVLAFRQTKPTDTAAELISASLAKAYESMNLEERINLRRHWHSEARREAFKHDDLRARLSWRYLV